MLLAETEERVFDDRRHSILRSELKSLYVGLTRARERVWIWEESGEGRAMEVMTWFGLRQPLLLKTLARLFLRHLALQLPIKEDWYPGSQVCM